jgi:hypothetical protein
VSIGSFHHCVASSPLRSGMISSFAHPFLPPILPSPSSGHARTSFTRSLVMTWAEERR